MKVVNVILLLLLVLLQYRLWTGNGGIPEVRRLEQQRAEQVQENKRLAQRNRALAAEVMDLKHGESAIEERARSEMGMIKSDETYYQIVNRPAVDPPEPAAD